MKYLQQTAKYPRIVSSGQGNRADGFAMFTTITRRLRAAETKAAHLFGAYLKVPYEATARELSHQLARKTSTTASPVYGAAFIMNPPAANRNSIRSAPVHAGSVVTSVAIRYEDSRPSNSSFQLDVYVDGIGDEVDIADHAYRTRFGKCHGEAFRKGFSIDYGMIVIWITVGSGLPTFGIAIIGN